MASFLRRCVRLSRRPALLQPAPLLRTAGSLFRSFGTFREKEEARKVFDLIDKDGNGTIELDEFNDFIKMDELYSSKGQKDKASEAAARFGWSQVDQAKDNKISFEEFFNWWEGSVTVVGIPASIHENMKKLANKK
mmetsp:Transcript_26484/g.42564  ORF Transcript_26484/g.42564 Transcript_26484/m.42564 type:complete len:136 (-) Transcript_26484:127-534(-)|eukprot:jgi/Bigna1/85075/estExt_fgenesh1_pg.C_20108